MKVTQQFIRDGASWHTGKIDATGWNAKQLSIFGLHYPLPQGWRQDIEGMEISEEDAKLFIELIGQSKKSENKIKFSLEDALKKSQLNLNI